MIVFGLLGAIAGGVAVVIEANNHAVCTGLTGAAGGNECIRDNAIYAAGGVVLLAALVFFLAGVIGAATDIARQRWRR